MRVLDQIEKALEPFAAAHATQAAQTGQYVNLHYERAAEALATLRQWREAEQGFEAWLRRTGYTRETKGLAAAAWDAAYLAGQLSGIPKELRETLMEACREAEHELRAEAANYRSRGRITDDVRTSGADATAERYADARKQLEAL